MDAGFEYIDFLYERGMRHMKPTDKKEKDIKKEKATDDRLEVLIKQVQEISDTIDKKKTFRKTVLEHPVVSVLCTVGLSALGWACVTLWNINGDVKVLTERINGVSGQLENTNGIVDKINEDIGQMKEIDTDLIARVENLEGDFSEVFTVMIKANEMPIVGTSYELSNPTWDSNDIIATDMSSGEEYSAEYLADKRLLIPYTSENQEIVFFGQFNENNHWDKNCILNVYVNDELTLIMDAEYDDGELMGYRQVLKETLMNGEKIWIIAEREHKQNLNFGETWNYTRKSDYYKEFELEEVKRDDVLSAEKFANGIDAHLESYYYGSTSDGTYNDETGNAYLVRYAEDGTIKTLYSGCFKDGRFHDETGNAWEIVFDGSHNINKYFYYKGIFKDGNRENDKGIEYVSQEQIDEITKGMDFNCKLSWYTTI